VCATRRSVVRQSDPIPSSNFYWNGPLSIWLWSTLACQKRSACVQAARQTKKTPQSIPRDPSDHGSGSSLCPARLAMIMSSSRSFLVHFSSGRRHLLLRGRQLHRRRVAIASASPEIRVIRYVRHSFPLSVWRYAWGSEAESCWLVESRAVNSMSPEYVPAEAELPVTVAVTRGLASNLYLFVRVLPGLQNTISPSSLTP
jgi:hypothetical protein